MKLEPHELATGMVFGVGRFPLVDGGSAATALEAAVGPALRRGRVFVSFSGGRDSSAVLAAAASVARREGLEPPVPVTIRAGWAADTVEATWQEHVIAHAGVSDWVRIEVEDELDAIGPHARAALTRHGLLWPFNAHFHVPLLAHAAGGTLLTGVGGDELWTAARVRRVRRRRHLLRLAPHALQRAVVARNERIAFPWLEPATVRAARRAAAAESATEPFGQRARMSWWRGLRYLAVGTRSLDRLAADAGAVIEHPLLDPAVWGALAVAAPRRGFANGIAARTALAGHLLPREVVERQTKAGFDQLFFHDHARAFAAEWDGRGLPPGVDPDALRAHWAGEHPDPHSLTLLQALWLASAGDRVQQPLAQLAEQ